MMYYVCRFLFYLLFKILFWFKVNGRENIPRKGGFIIASNHVSFADPPLIGVAAGRSLRYMARHDLFKNRFCAWVLRQWHVFPVKRDSADLAALKTALQVLKNNEGLLLFPEGARQASGEFSKPQPGVGFIARKSNVPIIPVFISGTEKALPPGEKNPRMVHVTVTFGRAIKIDKNMPYEAIAQAIMDNIKELAQSTKISCKGGVLATQK